MTTTVEYLGSEADGLLNYKAKVSSDLLHHPGGDFIDRTWKNSDRNPQVLRNLASIYNHGRLSGTGYVSILPVDRDFAMQCLYQAQPFQTRTLQSYFV